MVDWEAIVLLSYYPSSYLQCFGLGATCSQELIDNITGAAGQFTLDNYRLVFSDPE